MKRKVEKKLAKKPVFCYDEFKSNQHNEKGLLDPPKEVPAVITLTNSETFGKKNLDVLLPETTTGTGEVLEDTSETGRIRPWKKHKMSNVKLGELFELEERLFGEKEGHLLTESRMRSLKECAEFLWFLEDEKKKRRLHRANFCRVRLCPMCNWRRSLKLFSQVSAITDAILAEKKARFIFVTLTIQNVQGDALRETLDKLNKAFTYITAKSRNFAPAKKLKKNLLGYMKAEEITYNAERNDFHPHIHAILEVRLSYFKNGYIKQKDWTELWRSALGVGYDPIVDVRNIKGGTPKAVAEVAKYPVKMHDILKVADKEQAARALRKLYQAIFKRRLVTFGGDFREYRRRLQLDDVETGDLTHVETEEKTFNAVAQVLFKWHADVGVYIC